MTGKSSRAWTLLAIEGKRSYGGNIGYRDAPASEYRFDSGVGNGRHIKTGDLAFIRDREELIGVALIEAVTAEPGEKELLRCPVCRKTGIRERRNRRPPFRCSNGHEFEQPERAIIQVTKYEARYGGTFVEARGAVSGIDLRRAAFRTNDQMSIEEIDASQIADIVASAAPAARALLEPYFQRRGPDAFEDAADGGGNDYTPKMGDRRERVMAAICSRRGQAKFRRSLVRRYGGKCAISGCRVMAIVEAAHVWPYRGEGDNHPENGLLLRADLHTLYDLDLIRIDTDLRVWLAPELKGSEYEAFEGMHLPLDARPSSAGEPPLETLGNLLPIRLKSLFFSGFRHGLRVCRDECLLFAIGST